MTSSEQAAGANTALVVDDAAFPTLDDAQLAALGTRQSVPPGEYVYREGDVRSVHEYLAFAH